MRYFLLTILVSSVLIACSQTQTANLLDPNAFDENLSSTENALLIDVRTPEEFADGHLKGAVNIDYYADDFNSQIGKLDSNNTVFVYCGSGSRSRKTANALTKNGFKQIYDLNGGITEWINQGKEIVKN